MIPKVLSNNAEKEGVLTTESGYYGVNYDMIDVDMIVIR